MCKQAKAEPPSDTPERQRALVVHPSTGGNDEQGGAPKEDKGTVMKMAQPGMPSSSTCESLVVKQLQKVEQKIDNLQAQVKPDPKAWMNTVPHLAIKAKYATHPGSFPH